MSASAGKTVLVVGAATPVGRSVSHAFANEGADLVLTDVVSSHLEEVTNSIASHSRKQPRQQLLRVTSAEDWAAAVAVAQEEFGGLDLVVNAAEFDPGENWQDASVDDWTRAIEINFLGVVIGLKATYPALRISSGAFAVVSVDSASTPVQVLRGATREAARAFVGMVQGELAPEIRLATIAVPVGSESGSGSIIVSALGSGATRITVDSPPRGEPT